MSEEFKLYADFQKYNFFRRPDWRWERVLKLAGRFPTPGRPTRRDDQYVAHGRNFILRWQNDDPAVRESLMWEEPGLYYAYDFFRQREEDPISTSFFQARLLSGQSYPEIADAMGTAVPAVEWYEAMFFNVRDKLRHRDWITRHVLVPAFSKPTPPEDEDGQPIGPSFKDSSVAKPFNDGSLKMFAYFGGPLIADIMISGMQAGNPLNNKDDCANWLDGQWTTAIRRRSAQAAIAFEINKYNAMELFAVHTRIMEIERSEDSDNKRRSTHERHIEGLLNEIPWASGPDAERLHQGTIIGRMDNLPAELRDEELHLLAAGKPVPSIADAWPGELPPPRKLRQAALTSPAEAVKG